MEGGYRSIARVAAVQFVRPERVRLISGCPHKHAKWGFHNETQCVSLSSQTHNKHGGELNSHNTKAMKCCGYLQLQNPKQSRSSTIMNVIFASDWLPEVNDVSEYLAKRQKSHCPLLPHNESRLEQHQAVFSHLLSQRRGRGRGFTLSSQITSVRKTFK